MRKILFFIIFFIFSVNICAIAKNSSINNNKLTNKIPDSKQILEDKYNEQKDYFDYSVLLTEFPKEYYYTTVKINRSKERILIITNKVNEDKTTNHGLFYYFANNGFVYPLGYLESTKPFAQSKDYLYLNDGNNDIKFYASNKKSLGIETKVAKPEKDIHKIEFETIESSDRFAGDFGEAAGNDVVRAVIDGFYFEYHKPQYKKKYIKTLMRECIDNGVKTQVQMYCCMVNKIHG